MVVSRLKRGELVEKLRSPHDWRTSDEDEVLKRRARAHEEPFRIRNLDSRHPIFSNFRVGSPSGLVYSVEVRGLGDRQPGILRELESRPESPWEPAAAELERELASPGG